MVSSTAMRAELETVSESVEDNTLGSITTSLNSFDPNICYNLFLHKYNIPLLHHLQTLYTFIQYLQQHNFTKPFKVSINPTYTETHVYTNYNDILLPNHILLTYHQYSTYYQLPLKSSSNDATNNFLLKLNITTHNIQGYNTQEKRLLWEDYCLTHNLHIISLTETKISKNTKTKFWNTSHYSYFWSNSTECKEGTCIMIKNNIKPNIHNIITQPGGAIAIDLFFKHDYKFRVISVYLSSTNIANRKLTQDTAITWMQQAISSNLYPIILGDFNADNSTSTSSTTKFQLLNNLHNTNMYDLANYT